MAIKKWREVEGTDDGCYLYECLSCYKQWEARTSPKWAEWVHCPYCGCIWESELEVDTNVRWERSGRRYIKENTPTFHLEMLTYMDELDEEGKDVILENWFGVDVHICRDLDIEERVDKVVDKYDKKHYQLYIYYNRLAKEIVKAAGKEGYHGQNDPFLFVRKFSLRLKTEYGRVYDNDYRESFIPLAEDVLVNWNGILHEERVEHMINR